MKKFRWEYELGRSCYSTERRWFLYHEDVAVAREAHSLVEALEILPEREGPVWEGLNMIMKYSRETVELCPWEPVGIDAVTFETMGEGFPDRVQAQAALATVCGLTNGHVWLHLPGDSALDAQGEDTKPR